MGQTEPVKLVKLEDATTTSAEKHKDIRGYTVWAGSGEKIGSVEELLIDVEDEKVRFLIVASGGFLGIGKDKTFIPVDAVSRISNAQVLLKPTREQIAGAPEYDPDAAHKRTYYEGVYRHYGFSPYWSPGYAYPAYPYDPR